MRLGGSENRNGESLTAKALLRQTRTSSLPWRVLPACFARRGTLCGLAGLALVAGAPVRLLSIWVVWRYAFAVSLVTVAGYYAGHLLDRAVTPMLAKFPMLRPSIPPAPRVSGSFSRDASGHSYGGSLWRRFSQQTAIWYFSFFSVFLDQSQAQYSHGALAATASVMFIAPAQQLRCGHV